MEQLDLFQEMCLNLHISKGNSKLDGIQSFDLEPYRTCKTICPGCYAMKGRMASPCKIRCNNRNTDMLTKCEVSNNYLPFVNYMVFYFNHIYTGRYFRWHASGDIFSVLYAKALYDIMKQSPAVQFCIYTKSFDYIVDVPFYKLNNCHLFLSSWVGLEIPKELTDHYPIAWFRDKKGMETRIPDGTFTCPSTRHTEGAKITCSQCRHCYTNSKPIVFNEH